MLIFQDRSDIPLGIRLSDAAGRELPGYTETTVKISNAVMSYDENL